MFKIKTRKLVSSTTYGVRGFESLTSKEIDNYCLTMFTLTLKFTNLLDINLKVQCDITHKIQLIYVQKISIIFLKNGPTCQILTKHKI